MMFHCRNDRNRSWAAEISGWEMQKVGGNLHLSSVDLVGHLNCPLPDGARSQGRQRRMEKPKIWDPVLEVLAERGTLHERAFIEHIEGRGSDRKSIEGVGVDAKSLAATERAMAREMRSSFRERCRPAAGTAGPTFFGGGNAESLRPLVL